MVLLSENPLFKLSGFSLIFSITQKKQKVKKTLLIVFDKR